MLCLYQLTFISFKDQEIDHLWCSPLLSFAVIMHVCVDIIRLPGDIFWSFQFTDIKILNIGIFTNSTKDCFFSSIASFSWCRILYTPTTTRLTGGLRSSSVAGTCRTEQLKCNSLKHWTCLWLKLKNSCSLTMLVVFSLDLLVALFDSLVLHWSRRTAVLIKCFSPYK